MCRCKNGPTARDHSRQLRRHHNISGVGALGKEMDVRQVQQIIQLLGGLEWQDHYIGQVLAVLNKNRSIGAIAAKYKSYVGSMRQLTSDINQKVQALFFPHASGVESNDGFFRNAKFRAKRTRFGERVDRAGVHPIRKQNGDDRVMERPERRNA